MSFVMKIDDENNELSSPDKVTRMEDFFKDKSVFITGASGFMGSVLLEKLLWSCGGIDKIYIMLRDKKGVVLQERLKKLLNDGIFERIKQRDPSMLNKIKVIEGELAEKNLGISEEDRLTLQRDVSVVFHGATSVKFEEPLCKAILTNIRGTRDLLEIAKGMKNLVAFIYVSTAYTNTYCDTIEERVYTDDADWRSYIKMAEVLKDGLNSLRPKIINRHKNTYTFTKFLTENCVNDYRTTVPVAICRPSIVTYCLDEPKPGWVGNMYGPTTLWLGLATGIIHIIGCDAYNHYDLISCDYAINAFIVCAWYRGNKNTNKCITVNVASNDSKRECPQWQMETARSALEKYPLEGAILLPSFYCTPNVLMYTFCFVLMQIIPGLLLDLICNLRGSKFRIIPSFRMLYTTNLAFMFYSGREWNIINKNYYKLIDYIHPDDVETFKMDMKNFDYIKSSHAMVQAFKLILKEKDDEESLKRARTAYKRVYIMDCAVRALLLYGVCYIIYAMSYKLFTMASSSL